MEFAETAASVAQLVAMDEMLAGMMGELAGMASQKQSNQKGIDQGKALEKANDDLDVSMAALKTKITEAKASIAKKNKEVKLIQERVIGNISKADYAVLNEKMKALEQPGDEYSLGLLDGHILVIGAPRNKLAAFRTKVVNERVK